MSEKKFTRGSGNVFADLGFADAEERQTKARLALEINTIIDERGLTQAKAAALLDAAQPKISALARYKLEGFSVERLMTYLTALDRDVQIVIKFGNLAGKIGESRFALRWFCAPGRDRSSVFGIVHTVPVAVELRARAFQALAIDAVEWR
jgi:predicted XRE-type DNA-binding protein